jgi:hypothetical protein
MFAARRGRAKLAFSHGARHSDAIRPDGVARWSSNVRVRNATLHWWQVHGLVSGTSHDRFCRHPNNPVVAELIEGRPHSDHGVSRQPSRSAASTFLL